MRKKNRRTNRNKRQSHCLAINHCYIHSVYRNKNTLTRTIYYVINIDKSFIYYVHNCEFKNQKTKQSNLNIHNCITLWITGLLDFDQIFIRSDIYDNEQTLQK